MNSILLINKEEGFTSQDVVSKVKKILNIKKAGHAGTLDPLATGVLPILLNNATKLSKYLIEHDKIYIAKIKLGEKKDTGDREGKIIENKNVDKAIYLKNDNKYEKIEDVLKSFLGETFQKPPIYSAIKINGKKLYEYARKGEKVEIPERKINIYNIKLLSVDCEENEITFEVFCSKGTYIRVLCENIAELLNTVGYMKELKRIKVDKFKIEDAITLDKLEKIKNDIQNSESLEEKFKEMKCICMPEKIFEDYKNINLNSRKKELFLNGVMLTYELADGIYKIYSNETFIGLGTIKNNLLKRDVII